MSRVTPHAAAPTFDPIGTFVPIAAAVSIVTVTGTLDDAAAAGCCAGAKPGSTGRRAG